MEGRVKLSQALALVVGAVFVYAGVTKLPGLNRFAADVYGFRLLPWDGAVVLAFYLPWLEMLCGIGLQCKRLREGALVVLGTITAGFVGAVGSAIARGLDVSCGCFGKQSADSLWMTLMLDGALLVGLLALWLMQRKGCAETSRAALR